MTDSDPTRIVTRRISSMPTNADDTVSITGLARGKAEIENDDETKIFRPSRNADTNLSGGNSIQSGPGTDMLVKDPVVGWLVVVGGPGRGKFVPLGYGMNSIGRSPSERVALDFGDEEISRTAHAMVSFDPRGRRFYIQHGGGTNLTYVGNDPVLVPRELFGREEIGLGGTKLCFVPFCSKEFDWQDQ
jgi:hypothetical protein